MSVLECPECGSDIKDEDIDTMFPKRTGTSLKDEVLLGYSCYNCGFKTKVNKNKKFSL